MKINKLMIDSTHTRTPLCELGVKYPTDKSPYNVGSASEHRHPYTAVYDMLFTPLREKPITVGEIGIEYNHSMMCWREYFPRATLYGWEYDQSKINKARADNLLDTTYLHMDVRSDSSIEKGFSDTATMFDIIIDDSTHVFEDQLRVLTHVHKYVKPGGYFIIEDVFRNRIESEYMAAARDYLHYYYTPTFIETEHELRLSTGWDNDKLLVFVRNDK